MWTKHAHHFRTTHLVIMLTFILNLSLVQLQVATYMVVMQRCCRRAPRSRQSSHGICDSAFAQNL